MNYNTVAGVRKLNCGTQRRTDKPTSFCRRQLIKCLATVDGIIITIKGTWKHATTPRITVFIFFQRKHWLSGVIYKIIMQARAIIQISSIHRLVLFKNQQPLSVFDIYLRLTGKATYLKARKTIRPNNTPGL